MYQPKVNNTQKYEDSQGSHVVTNGKLTLINKGNTEPEVGQLRKDGEGYYHLYSESPDEIKNAMSGITKDFTEQVIPIIISETEEIEEGDKVFISDENEIVDMVDNQTYLGGSKYPMCGLYEKCYKILALLEHFSDKHLQAIVDGKMKDGDEVLVKCDSIKGFYDRVPGDLNYGVETYTKGYKVHLDQQNHITLFPAKQSLEEAAKEHVAWNSCNIDLCPEHSKRIKDFKAGAEWAKKNNY